MTDDTQVLERIKTPLGEVALKRGTKKYYKKPNPVSHICEAVILPDVLHIAVNYYFSKDTIMRHTDPSDTEMNKDRLCPLIRRGIEERFGICGHGAAERFLYDDSGMRAGKAVEVEYSLLEDEELKISYPWVRGYTRDEAEGKMAIAHIAKEMQEIYDKANRLSMMGEGQRSDANSR